MAEPEADRSISAERRPQYPSEGYAVRLYPIDQDNELRLIDLWRVLWAGKWQILSAALAGVAIALAASFFMTPVYRAEVLLAPVAAERNSGGLAGLAGQLSGIAALAGVNIGTGDSSAEALAILQSRAFTEQFIERHDLMPVLFAESWNANTRTWEVDDPAEIPTLWRANERFAKSVRSVSQDTATGLVTLTVDWSDPLMARDWANALVDEVNADVRQRSLKQSAENIEFLREQMKVTSEIELREAIAGVMEAEMKNSMLANVRTEFAFKVIDPAVTPEKRLWPNRALLAALGLAGGFFLGLIAVLVRHWTHKV